jgi:hypothetical protein
VAEIVPPPATTDHVGVVPVMVFPFAAFVTTVNCCVPPGASVAEAGATVSDVIGLKSVLLEHPAMNRAANALATITRMMRARWARDLTTRLVVTLSIEPLLTGSM